MSIIDSTRRQAQIDRAEKDRGGLPANSQGWLYSLEEVEALLAEIDRIWELQVDQVKRLTSDVDALRRANLSAFDDLNAYADRIRSQEQLLDGDHARIEDLKRQLVVARQETESWMKGCRDARAEITWLMGDLEKAEQALSHIAGDRCSSFTGAWSCRSPRSGRRKDAPFGADQWCDQCVATDALGHRAAHQSYAASLIAREKAAEFAEDDPFTKMDIPEDELPFIQVDNSYGVFVQIVDPDLVVMVRRKEQS
jgi:hypothetical protein